MPSRLNMKPETLYEGVDQQAMMKTASSSLLRFGGNFSPELITHAEGIYSMYSFY